MRKKQKNTAKASSIALFRFDSSAYSYTGWIVCAKFEDHEKIMIFVWTANKKINLPRTSVRHVLKICTLIAEKYVYLLLAQLCYFSIIIAKRKVYELNILKVYSIDFILSHYLKIGEYLKLSSIQLLQFSKLQLVKYRIINNLRTDS